MHRPPASSSGGYGRPDDIHHTLIIVRWVTTDNAERWVQLRGREPAVAECMLALRDWQGIRPGSFRVVWARREDGEKA